MKQELVMVQLALMIKFHKTMGTLNQGVYEGVYNDKWG